MELTVKNEKCSVTFSDEGAMLRSLKKDGIEYLWQGDPAYWAGQAPVCFPIAGVLPEGKATAFGKPCQMKRHGVARITPFKVLECHKNGVTFVQHSNEETKKAYPFDYELEIRYELLGSTVSNAYVIRNCSDGPMPFAIGGHPAFRCPLTDGEKFEDYSVVFDRKMTKQALRPDHHTGLVDISKRYDVLSDSDTIKMRHDLFYDDALIFDDIPSKKATLIGPAGKGVCVEYQDMPNLLIWSAENDAPFVALEPWHGISHCSDEDAVFENKRYMTVLQPGETASFRFKITMI